MKRLLAISGLALWLATAGAEVTFTDWDEASLGRLIKAAGEDGQVIMLVISQNDWCPDCIRLDRDLLSNPDASAIRNLSRDWLVLDVPGYDARGASVLAAHAVQFLGTPTTFILKARPDTRRLGDARVIGSIVGYTDDYMGRLEAVAAGFDALATAQTAMRESGTTNDYLTLARVYVEQGDRTNALRAFGSLLYRDDLEGDARRDVRWEMIVTVTQRVGKDHEQALAEMDRFAGVYPEFAAGAEFAYHKAWSLMALGRVDEARPILNESFRDGGDAESTYDYLYVVFRNPQSEMLQEAEVVARAAITEYPEESALFHHALGRILRREGRYEEAAEAFQQAIALANVDDEFYPVYIGQLEYVRSELAAARDN